MRKDRRFCSTKCGNDSRSTQDPLKHLLSQVKKEDNGCWTYTGFKDHGGYGQIKVKGISHNVHKLMWVLWNKKDVPEGQVVRHTCIKNRACINPDHLIIGTPLQNVHDEIEQGTFNTGRGEERTTAKLSDDKVREIRKLRPIDDPSPQYTYKELGNMFGVSAAAVWFVVKHKQWVHVD